MRRKHIYLLGLGTAMLAMAACNLSYEREPVLDATLEKMYGTNKTMNLACAELLKASEGLFRQMELHAAHQGNDKASIWLSKGASIRLERTKIVAHINTMRDRLVQLSGGYHLERLVGAKDKHQMEYTLGENEQGEGYRLVDMLLSHRLMLQKKLPELPIAYFPIGDGIKEIPKDLAKYYFEDMPALGCLSVLQQIELELLIIEVKSLEYLLKPEQKS